jgi:acetyl-CoA synthetase
MAFAVDAAVATLLCDRHPGTDPALTAGSRTYSFGGLADMSGRVARVLSGLGAGPRDRVATLLPAGLELVASMLGVWRLGAVLVPVAADSDRSLVDHALTDSRARAVITDTAHRAAVEGAPGRRVLTAGGGPIGDLDFWAVVDAACDPLMEAAAPGGAAPLVQLYTPGVERPEALIVPIEALASFEDSIPAAGPASDLLVRVVGPMLRGQPARLSTA